MFTNIKFDKSDTSGLLSAAINAYNNDMIASEENEDKIEQLEAKLTQSYTEQESGDAKSALLCTQLNAATDKNKSYEDLLLVAEKNAHGQLATQRELVISKNKVTELQRELSKLKNGESPDKLKKQLIVSKKKRHASTKNNISLKKQRNDGYRIISDKDKALFSKDEEIRLLNKQLAHNTGAGLFHKGEHHLIIWPEKTTFERPDGTSFQGRSLLYLHQSGRGGMISYDPISNSSHLCKAPKAGLRPSEDCKVFAKDWLYTVNEVQDGIVHEKDMFPVNYNPDLEPENNKMIK